MINSKSALNKFICLVIVGCWSFFSHNFLVVGGPSTIFIFVNKVWYSIEYKVPVMEKKTMQVAKKST